MLALYDIVYKSMKNSHKHVNHGHKSGFLSWLWRHIKRFILKIILLIISIGLIGSGAVAIWFSTLQIPDLSAFDQRQVSQSTKIYDRTGTVLLYDVHENTQRTVIPFEDISRHIKNGILAIEDNEFYSHIGIQPRSILRAVIANLIPGGLKQGGSTITQQVIKNTVLTSDRTVTRKIKEWVLAIKLEKKMTKDQIFGIYLNETPWGGSLYGVEEASKAFFGVSAKDVTLAEAAYIAALPQAPSFYSPYGKNKEKLDERQRTVLRKMRDYGFITDKELEQALNEKVIFQTKTTGSIKAPHFSLMVRDALISKYGEDLVQNGGLKVITSLNYDYQSKAESVVKRFASTLENNFNASNTAMIAIDPKTGDILTMIGSRDYFDKKIDGNFNVSLAQRQPGSSIKPFVYATAFMKGYYPDTILFDTKTEFSSECNPDGTPKDPRLRALMETNPSDVKPEDQEVLNTKSPCYSPNNYDFLFEGPITIRRALAQSRNIPAIKTLYLAGIPDSIKTAEAMGITSLTDPDRYGLTLVLGGGEVSLLELTSGYAVFANEGVRNPYRYILKVEDSKGNILEEATTNPAQVIPVNVAREISDILSDTKERSASVADIINPLKRDMAVKTGTTNDYRDVWFLGYTPSIAIGAWAGKNDNTSMSKKVAGLIITPVWAAFFNEISDSLPKETFKSPDPTPDNVKPVLRGIWKGGRTYIRDKISGKLATDLTPKETREEIVLNEVHSILYWLDKRDPNGEIPRTPENDNQFRNWEYGVREWFKNWQTNNPQFIEGTQLVVPSDKDDIHTKDNQPKVKILSPSSSRKYSKDDTIPVQLEIKAKYQILKTEFFVNDRLIGSTDRENPTISIVPNKLDGISTNNTLRAIVTDVTYNKGEVDIDFLVDE